MIPRPFHILIVSPNRSHLRRLSRFLDAFGYQIHQATNRDAAIAVAEADRPDFLILDAGGGAAASLPLCREIRRIWPRNYTYSLLLSQRLEVGDVTAALEAGFDDFLADPIVFGELLARLRVGARFIEFEKRVAEQAGVDPLTGLADKSVLKQELSRRSNGAKGAVGWLALFDLDDFERVIGRQGNGMARQLLSDVAQHFREQAVDGSAAHNNLVVALEDGRFAIAFTASGHESALAWCEERLLNLAEATFTVGEQECKLTASCGVTEIIAGENFDVVEGRAIRALGLAQTSGRNCAVTSDEVERDSLEWAELAADGKLFETTLARDVMHLCPVLLHIDETLEQAHALLSQTGLAHAPVIDNDKRLAGLVALDQLSAARLRNPKPRGDQLGGSSVRLVRHVMTKDVTRFDVDAPLAELMEFFTGENSSLAVIVRDKEPRGLVYCHSLASLNERLTADHFAASQAVGGSSADLLVPDLALVE